MDQPAECVICKLLAGELEVSMVHRDKLCSVFMDINPVNRGHVLVVPNRHTAEVTGLTEAESARIFVLAQHVNAALRKSGVKCEGINFFVADGEAAGQEVFHVHLHIFPRFKKDGFRLVLPPGCGKQPSRKKLDETAALIKKHLMVDTP
jgi:histidine triad (HIT) family protein